MRLIIAGRCPLCDYQMVVLLNDHLEQANACPRCHYAYTNAREFSSIPKTKKAEAIWDYIYQMRGFNNLEDMQFTFVKLASDYVNDGEPLKNFAVLKNPHPSDSKFTLPYHPNSKSAKHKCRCSGYDLLHYGCRCGGI